MARGNNYWVAHPPEVPPHVVALADRAIRRAYARVELDFDLDEPITDDVVARVLLALGKVPPSLPKEQPG
jgi:hypothetical protein